MSWDARCSPTSRCSVPRDGSGRIAEIVGAHFVHVGLTGLQQYDGEVPFADEPVLQERFDRAVDAGAIPERVVVEKAVADGLGMDIDVKNSQGVLVVNVGYETTEISILSLVGIVLSLQALSHQFCGNFPLHRQTCDNVPSVDNGTFALLLHRTIPSPAYVWGLPRSSKMTITNP